MDWTFTIGNISFGILDIILAALLFISTVAGFGAGFSRFVFKIAGYVFTFPAALLFVSPLSSFIEGKTALSPLWTSLISYCVLCLVIFSLFKLIGNLLGTALETLSLGWLDGLLGAVSAFVIAFFLLFVVLSIASLQPFYPLDPLKENSFFYKNVYTVLFPSLENDFKGALLGV